MRSTFKQLYYINRSKVKADGTTAIWCRISIDGKQAVLSTGIYCNPDDWNSKKGEVKDVRTNGRLSQYRQHIEDTYDTILKEQGVVSAELLKNRFFVKFGGTSSIVNKESWLSVVYFLPYCTSVFLPL